MTDTPNSETVVEPKNDATPSVPAPQVNTVDTAEVERLKKEAAQAQMRANQLQNMLDKKAAEEEAARLKQLEENNEWKSIAEQNRAKLEALEAEREAEERSKELAAAKQEVFKEFPAEVIEIAEETGLGLTDATEEEKANLKAKLERIQTKVVTSKPVTPNNPANPAPLDADRSEKLKRMGMGDKQARQEIISSLPGVEAMRKMAGFQQ